MVTKQQEKFAGFELGTGAIIRSGNKFVFAIQKPKRWKQKKGKLTIPYTGIGGQVEPNETPEKALTREIREEASTGSRIVHAKKTTLIKGKIVRDTTVKSSKKPAAIYLPNPKEKKAIFIYHTKLHKTPKPADNPALIYLTPRQIADTIRRQVPLHELLKNGAKLIAKTQIPPSAIITPYGTPRVMPKIIRAQSRLKNPIKKKIMGFISPKTYKSIHRYHK
jgi:ADP-ribose pyrophosphatase YjhB (NUDIX family)